MASVTEIPDLIHASVSSVAKRLRSRYHPFVEYEDLQQELYIWYLKSGHRKLKEWQEQHVEKSVQRLVTKSLWNAGEKYARKEKALQTGYEPEDEFFYSIPMVADMLTLYLDPDWTAPRGITYDNIQVASGKPSSEGSFNLQTMVADVGKAYEALSESDKGLLSRVYTGDPREVIAVLALEWNITPNAADHRVRRVVGRIRAALGGPKPYEETVSE